MRKSISPGVDPIKNVTVITGGGRGIGSAIAQACAARGDSIWVIDLGAEPPADFPADWHYYAADVSDQKAVQAACDHIVAAEGRLDVLVNNAGITADGLAVRLSAAQWEKVLQVNLNGAFWWAQAALRVMIRQRSGYIINLSSIVASTGNAGQVNYAASKAGIEAMTKTLAREYGPRGVLVNAIAPSFIATAMTDALPEAVKEEAIARTSVRRAGTPQDIAEMVAFLTSGRADYVTGQIIHITGGMW